MIIAKRFFLIFLVVMFADKLSIVFPLLVELFTSPVYTIQRTCIYKRGLATVTRYENGRKCLKLLGK